MHYLASIEAINYRYLISIKLFKLITSFGLIVACFHVIDWTILSYES